MKPKTIHVVDSFNRGGTQIALLTLVERGFYGADDLKVVGLVRGTGDTMMEAFQQKLGADNAYVLRDKTAITGWDFPFFTAQLARIFARVKPDNVVLSIEAAQITGRLAALRLPNIKVISFEHFSTGNGSLEAGLEAFAVRLALRATAARNDLVFGDCAATLCGRQDFYAKKTPAYVVPLSILDVTEPRGPAVPEVFHILSVGRLVSEKNFVELIHAVEQLAQAGKETLLTIAGEGPLHTALTACIAQLGLGDKVLLVGMKSADELAALRQQAHIYVQPSRHEGFCLATAEALAAGMPVVATNFAGTREYGNNGVNMIVADGYDRRKLAHALAQLMERYATLAPTLSQGAIATAKALFSEYAVRERWESARTAMETRLPSGQNGLAFRRKNRASDGRPEMA